MEFPNHNADSLIGKTVKLVDNSYLQVLAGIEIKPVYLAGTSETKPIKVLVLSEKYKMTVKSNANNRLYEEEFITVLYNNVIYVALAHIHDTKEKREWGNM